MQYSFSICLCSCVSSEKKNTNMIVLLVWTAVLIAAVTLYLRQVYSKFEKYGVKNIKPIPILGNVAAVLLRREHFGHNINKLYKAFPGEKFVGRFEFITPVVLIRDVELIRKIGVKDFEHFLDHRSSFSESDSYFGRSLIALKGQEWKDMRSTLSPAFTSSKIRLMVPFMVEVGDQMMATIKKNIKSSGVDYIDMECKDLTTRYANDVIASCAFGLKVNSHTERNNEFYIMGKNVTTFGFRLLIMFLLLLHIPIVGKLFKLDFMTFETKEFFKKLVLGTMKDRELRNIVRPDMIHLLMEAKKGKLSHENVKSNEDSAGFATVKESAVGTKEVNRVWTEQDLIAQAVLFFIAGFDTVSTATSFLLYELALNPEVQDKLAQEIKDHDIKNGGKFSLKSIQDMPYLDMVVSESLRMWPPAMILDRICNKDYNLGRPNEMATKDFIVEKGAAVNIPVFAFHRDPQYFPNPDKFDPMRFSDENKHNIHPFAYMPFGIGPRNCIGSRFALCEVKVMVYQILQHLVVSPCEKTCIPAELSLKVLNVQLKGGTWLRFKTRI